MGEGVLKKGKTKQTKTTRSISAPAGASQTVGKPYDCDAFSFCRRKMHTSVGDCMRTQKGRGATQKTEEFFAVGTRLKTGSATFAFLSLLSLQGGRGESGIHASHATPSLVRVVPYICF